MRKREGREEREGEKEGGVGREREREREMVGERGREIERVRSFLIKHKSYYWVLKFRCTFLLNLSKFSR